MTLIQLQQQIEQKRGELAALFAKHKTADGSYDMPVEVIEEVNRRNDELTELGKKCDQARQLAELERKNAAALESARTVARPPLGGGEPAPHRKSIGDLFVESAAYREYKGGRSPVAAVDLDVKTLFQTGAGWDPEDLRTGRVELMPLQQPRVVDLIPKTTTTQSTVLYMEETTHTNNAAEVAEGGTYGEAALALTEKSSEVRKVAVWLPVTDEQFEDEPRARDYVNNRLRFMLEKRLDQQILIGNGTSPNLRGVNNVTGILTQAKGADPTPDAFFKAMTKIRAEGFADPDAIIIHPNDWQDIRLLRTADGLYIWGNPADAGPERMWGLPVVQTTHQTENTGVVGSFREFSELSLRRGIEFQVTNSHSTHFVEGKQAIRADFRAALIFYRPKAFCTVTGI